MPANAAASGSTLQRHGSTASNTHGKHAQLFEVFHSVMDTNKDGLLNESELRAALQRLNLYQSEAACKKMLLEADTDQDGKIDFAEFIKATNKTFPSQQWNDFQAAMPVKGMREIFNSFDEDRSGSIGPSDFRRLCHDLEPSMEPSMVELAIRELDADGDGEISFDEFKNWWDAAMAGKAHFAHIALRGYDEIFSTNHITDVVKGNGPRLWGLPLARWAAMGGFIVGTVLNTVNIVKGFTRNLPKQGELLAGLQAGTVQASRAHCSLSKNATSTDCAEWERVLDRGFVTLLVMAELALLLVHVLFFLVNFAAIRGASTQVESLANSNRWICVAESFEWLGGISSASALKILPQIKQTPARLVSKFKMSKERLTEDDGVFTAGDKIYLAVVMLGSVVALMVISFAGIIALHLKLMGLHATLGIPIGRWGTSRWVAFLGFANQIAGLVPFGKVKKEAILFFIFTGADAQLSNEEDSAMHQFAGQLTKRIFKHWGNVRGFLVANSFSDKDMQKVVIKEHAHEKTD